MLLSVVREGRGTSVLDYTLSTCQRVKHGKDVNQYIVECITAVFKIIIELLPMRLHF